MDADAITFTAIIAHEDILEAEKRDGIGDLIKEATERCREKIGAEVIQWLARNSKAKRIDPPGRAV